MVIKNQTFDEERALYASNHTTISFCDFKGPLDGESALKECRHIQVEHCNFELRYPFWHNEDTLVSNITMNQGCRAACWYDKNLTITDSVIGGIKAIRECDHTTIRNCEINSTEFGWYCRDLTLLNSKLVSEYPFMQCRNMNIDHLEMKAKYSFQYVENATITNSFLDTKDAFWHSKNITVIDSVIKGEYLAWYSEGLTLIRCKIIGTQPLCYAKNLVLEDCEMIDCDLAFEYSDVQATIKGIVDSIKNPHHGYIRANHIHEIILDENQYHDSDCVITEKGDF